MSFWEKKKYGYFNIFNALKNFSVLKIYKQRKNKNYSQ